MYCTLVAPGTAATASAGLASLATCILTESVCPFADRLRLLDRTSNEPWLTPPITGYRPSPAGSLRPLTGVFDGPVTFVPNNPVPEDWRATVITPAPQWSATCTVHVLGGCTRLLEVSSSTTSAA